jgi:hypothetical protein
VHLRGSRVEGIRHTAEGRWEVHVVMASDSTVSLVEAEVLGAVQSVGIIEPVDLFVDDIAERLGELPPGDQHVDMLPPGSLP